MQEVGVTMSVAEFRQKWYGEDEATSRARAAEVVPTGYVTRP